MLTINIEKTIFNRKLTIEFPNDAIVEKSKPFYLSSTASFKTKKMKKNKKIHEKAGKYNTNNYDKYR